MMAKRFGIATLFLLASFSLPIVVHASQPGPSDLQGQIKNHFIRGRFFISRHNYASASHEFEEVIKLNPRLGNAYLDLGACDIEQKKFDEAIPLLEKALSVDIGRAGAATAHANIGWAYLKTHKELQAVEEFKTALTLDPSNDGAQRGLKYATPLNAWRNLRSARPSIVLVAVVFSLLFKFFRQKNVIKDAQGKNRVLDDSNTDQIREEFQRRKRRQNLLLWPLILVVLWIEVMVQNTQATFEHHIGILVGAPVLFSYVLFVWIFTFFNWRCPKCGRHFWNQRSMAFCPYCGASFVPRQ